MKVIDRAIKALDSPYIKRETLNSIIDELENLSSRIKAASEKVDGKNSASLKRSSEDVKEVANNLRLYLKNK